MVVKLLLSMELQFSSAVRRRHHPSVSLLSFLSLNRLGSFWLDFTRENVALVVFLGWFFFGFASSEDPKNLHCELITQLLLLLLSIMLALVTFFPPDVFRLHRVLGQE